MDIQRGVPIPKPKTGRPNLYPFDGMTAGDMFEIVVRRGQSSSKIVARARSAASSWRQRKGVSLSFIVRDTVNAQGKQVVRVWAVALQQRGERRAAAAPLAPR